MKFLFAIKKNLFTLLFIADEKKYDFVSGVVGVNQSIIKCKQTRLRYRGKHVGGNNTDIYYEIFALNNAAANKNSECSKIPNSVNVADFKLLSK